MTTDVDMTSPRRRRPRSDTMEQKAGVRAPNLPPHLMGALSEAEVLEEPVFGIATEAMRRYAKKERAGLPPQKRRKVQEQTEAVL